MTKRQKNDLLVRRFVGGIESRSKKGKEEELRFFCLLRKNVK